MSLIIGAFHPRHSRDKKKAVQTESGDLIPLVDSKGHTVPWSADPETAPPGPNESDLFYVLPDTEVEIEPSQRAVPRELSAQHALFRAQFTAILDDRDPASVVFGNAAWAEKTKGHVAGTEMLEVKLGREGSVHVPVSRALKSIEQKILAAPDGPISWRIPLNLGVLGTSTGEINGWPSGAASERFIGARTRYFEAVRCATAELVTQGIAAAAADLASDYAEAYLELIADLTRRAEASAKSDSQRAFSDLRKVLALDSVLLAIVDYRGRRRDAVLVAPTHPLRALVAEFLGDGHQPHADFRQFTDVHFHAETVPEKPVKRVDEHHIEGVVLAAGPLDHFLEFGALVVGGGGAGLDELRSHGPTFAVAKGHGSPASGWGWTGWVPTAAPLRPYELCLTVVRGRDGCSEASGWATAAGLDRTPFRPRVLLEMALGGGLSTASSAWRTNRA